MKNEDLIDYLEHIVEMCSRMQPGNVSHESKEVMGICRNIIDTLKLEEGDKV